MARTTGYGLKEVADVKFYPISSGMYITASNGVVTVKDSSNQNVAAAYTFDSLKVSNIEVSSETTEARGGKGNPKLITWSYGKEATLTVEDALLSMDTLDLMFGGKETSITDTVTIDGSTFTEAYFIVGETVLRPYDGSSDVAFSFVIPKGRPQVSGSLSMSADGDPTTFEMTIDALAADLKTGADAEATKDVLIQFIKA